MRFTRTNDSIHWLAVLLAGSALAMPSNRLAISVALASLLLVAIGSATHRRMPNGGARSLRHIVAPALAIAFALAVVVRDVA